MIDINQIPDQIDIPVVTYVASNAKTTVPKDASRPVIKLEACMGAETQSQGITELSPSQEVVNELSGSLAAAYAWKINWSFKAD
jgi:hypothetical protein